MTFARVTAGVEGFRRKLGRSRAARIRALRVVTIALLLAGCTREPERVGLSAQAFNYSDDHIARIMIDGKEAGSRLPPVKPGGVSGGGAILDQRLAELKIRPEATYPLHMMNSGPTRDKE